MAGTSGINKKKDYDDPQPGPSTSAAEFDLEVFDSGSSCSLEDCWCGVVAAKLDEEEKKEKGPTRRLYFCTDKKKKKSTRSKKKKRAASSSSSSESSSLADDERLRHSCRMEDDGDEVIAGPSGVNSAGGGGSSNLAVVEEDPPASACPSETEDDGAEIAGVLVLPPVPCAAARAATIDRWAAAATAAANSSSYENIDEIVQDHDNFGTDENEDSLDCSDLSGNENSNSLSLGASLSSAPSEGLELSLGPAGNTLDEEMEVYSLAPPVASNEPLELQPQQPQQQLQPHNTISVEGNSVAPSDGSGVLPTKRRCQSPLKSTSVVDDDSGLSKVKKKKSAREEDEVNRQHLEQEVEEEAAAAEMPLPVPISLSGEKGPAASDEESTPANLAEWLNVFNRWNHGERLAALDHLIGRCQASQVGEHTHVQDMIVQYHSANLVSY